MDNKILSASRTRHLNIFAASFMALLISAAPAAEQTTVGVNPAKPVPAPVTPISLDKREIRAQLMPRRYTTLAAEIGAKVNRVGIQEGGSFRAGETLIAFDCSLQHAQLNKAKAALDATEFTWKANKRLNELNSVGKVELGISEAEVTKARAEVAANAAVIAKCAIAAPFSGRIAEQKVREQQFVQPGQALLEILDDSVLELEFLVPSKWMTWIKTGYGFQVKIDETARSYPAKVIRIGARVDSVSQSIKITAAIDGKFHELVAGMSGQVNIQPPVNP